MTDSHERFNAFSTAVLDLVDRIPPGRVMTFGAIAEHLGQGGPRGVGGVMARHGYDVAWWRVVRADGTLPAYLMIDAQPHWVIERTPTRRGLVNVREALWLPCGEPTTWDHPRVLDQPPEASGRVHADGAGRHDKHVTSLGRSAQFGCA